MELIQTKLTPPHNPSGLIERQRLSGLLEQVLKSRVVLIQAPAGFGKSSLLSQWFGRLRASGYGAGWLNIDRGDRDPLDLLTYLAAAIGQASPSAQPRLERLARNVRDMTVDAMVAALVNQLCSATGPIFLMVDDLHLLDAPCIAALARLIELAPESVHFILASREAPDLHLGRYRAQGHLLEVGVRALRFTSAETEQFMSAGQSQSLAEYELLALEQRTEGWITGIKLASMALRGDATPSQVLAAFTGSQRLVSDFFAEEVLAAQSPQIRDFLLKTSWLDRLSPALCDAVVGEGNSRVLIDQVESSGLFLLQLDDQRLWYRYHHLFMEFLQRKYEDQWPASRDGLLLRASQWFFAEGLYVEAIEYALRVNDFQRAAQILESCCLDLTYSGRIRLAVNLALRIPRDVLQQFPAVMLTWVWSEIRCLRFESAQTMLASVRERLHDLAASGAAAPAELTKLHYLLEHREMTLAAGRDEALKVEQQCQGLIANYAEDIHPYLAATIFAQLIYAQREQFKFTEIEPLAARARGILQRSGHSFGLISVQSTIGLSLFAAGKTQAATTALEEAWLEAISYGGEISALSALPGLALSAIFYEQNQLDRVDRYHADLLACVGTYGFVDHFLAGYITQARMHLLGDAVEAAFRVLDEGLTIAFDRGLERLRLGMVAERLRLMAKTGSTARQLRQYAEAAAIPDSGDELAPGHACSTADESRALAWLRVAQSAGQMDDAIHLAKLWRGFCGSRAAQLSFLRWTLLLAQLQLTHGEPRVAQRTLREALAAAAPIGAIRSFIDEGPIIQGLLQASYQEAPVGDHPTDVFALELIRHFAGSAEHAVANRDDPVAEGLYGQLTDREIEVLALISAGMSNREAAAKMGLTEGSVKWYMQMVFDKLGTRRRGHAVVRARQLGLIK